jgi:hypothetical protein
MGILGNKDAITMCGLERFCKRDLVELLAANRRIDAPVVEGWLTVNPHHSRTRLYCLGTFTTAISLRPCHIRPTCCRCESPRAPSRPLRQ